MDKTNGYVNATKMCRAGGKDFYDWSRLKGSQELMQTLQLLNVDTEALGSTHHDENALQGTPPQIPGGVCKYIEINMKTDKDKLISGTYVHPGLVPSVAGWISSEFQIKANRVVNGYITRQYNEQLDILKHQNCSLQQMIAAKDNIIETAGQEHIEQLKLYKVLM